MPLTLVKRQRDLLRKNFTYHPPKGDQAERYSDIRAMAHELATLLLKSCPESKELDMSIECLRECVMWANASIACNESEIN